MYALARSAQENVNEQAATTRERYLELHVGMHDNESTPNFVPNEPASHEGLAQIHVRNLKQGINHGVLTLHMLEFVRRIECHTVGFCCSDCVPAEVYIHNLDAVYDPMQISERLAPGRIIKIIDPVLDEDEDVRVDDPVASLIFPVVRPRCFKLGCESAGLLKCSRCKLITYCSKV